MAVTNPSSPPSGEAVRAGLTGILSEFRASLEEEINTDRRTTAPGGPQRQCPMSTSEWSGKGWTVTVTDTEMALAQASGPVTISSTNAARLEVRRRWFRWSLHDGREPLVHLRGITKTEASALLACRLGAPRAQKVR